MSLEATTMSVVPTLTPDSSPASSTPESFGTWLKYVRQLSGLSQKEAAKLASVSFDSVKRLEGGQLVGSAHLLGWLSWLAEYPTESETDTEMLEEIKRWPMKLLAVGDYVRDHGLALKQPKAKVLRNRRLDITKEAARINRVEAQKRKRK